MVIGCFHILILYGSPAGTDGTKFVDLLPRIFILETRYVLNFSSINKGSRLLGKFAWWFKQNRSHCPMLIAKTILGPLCLKLLPWSPYFLLCVVAVAKSLSLFPGLPKTLRCPSVSVLLVNRKFKGNRAFYPPN